MYDDAIWKAGIKWEDDIIHFCTEIYKDHWLPSHDIGHHRRVWQNACLITTHFTFGIKQEQDEFFEQLIIACYFHDIGLLYEKGPRHGKESRRICEQFLHLHANKIQFETSILLHAIEHHDDKEYHSTTGYSQSGLYEILTLADDLDAFGAIGCYRYIEIYLVRHIIPDEIPARILANAGNRYRNFKSKFSKNTFMLQFIRKKYDLLEALLKNDTFTSVPESLVEWMNAELVIPQLNPFAFFRKIRLSGIGNDRIAFFIKKINIELQ